MEKQKSNSERIGFSKGQMIQFLKIMQINTDRLIKANAKIMQLEQSVFHEKWRVRHLIRLVKYYNPDEPVSEEELDAQIKGGMN